MADDRSAAAVLGTGRLGRALSLALARTGADVVAWNRSAPALDLFRRALPGAGVASTASEACADAGLVLLAVSDDAIPAVAAALAGSQTDWNARLVVHCSGRLGPDVLAPLAARGAAAVAAHPVMTFAGDAAADADRLVGAGWGVTAEPAALGRGFAFAQALGGRPFAVEASARALYHAALAHAINHLAVAAVQGTALLRRAGASDPAAVLRPAVEAALANALAGGTASATGPLVRGDAGTVAAHRRALADAAPGVLPAYDALAAAGTEAALAAGRITANQAEALQRVLAAG